MLRTVLIYGLALAAGAFALQWLDYLPWARARPGEAYIGLVAAAFLSLGVWMGARAFRPRAQNSDFEPNLRALASLGITAREYEVLKLLASGLSNKEIARLLDVSLNTVKTHIGRLYHKLEAARRTKAVLRAGELQLIP